MELELSLCCPLNVCDSTNARSGDSLAGRGWLEILCPRAALVPLVAGFIEATVLGGGAGDAEDAALFV